MLKRLLVVVAAAGAAIGFAGVPAAAGGGCTEVISGKSRAVDLKALCVIPTLIRVPAGTEVTFVNRDATDHVIVGSGMTWGSDGTMRQGDSFSATFERAGVYPFQCYLHPGMSGAVLVGDANGPGAASSFGVTVPPPSSPAAAGGQVAERATAPRAATDGTPWATIALSGLAGAFLAVAAGGWFVRSRMGRPRPPAAA
jgi:plastocyanin